MAEQEIKELRKTVLAMVAELDATQEESGMLYAAINTATDTEQLQNIMGQINEMIARVNEDQSDQIINLINEQLGIVRIDGKSEFLILDEKRWTKGKLFDTHSNSKDAKGWLSRMGIPVTTTVMVDGKAKQIDEFERWFNSPKAISFEGITYKPNADKCVDGHLNMWRKSDLEPIKGNKHQHYLDFLKEVIANDNEDDFNYLVNWLAHMVQKPEVLPKAAIVLHGKQGTGKGTFTEVIEYLVGKRNYASDVRTKDLMGSFNSAVLNKICVNVNEATFSGNHEQVENMKKYITEREIIGEQKGREAVHYPNYARYVISTNNVKWGHLDSDDRRFMIYEPSDKYKSNAEYYDAIRNDLYENGGINNLLDHLMNVDISAFDTRRFPAQRERGLDTLNESLKRDSGLHFLYDLASMGSIESMGVDIECGNRVNFTELHKVYLDTAPRYSNTLARNQFSSFLTLNGMEPFRHNNKTWVNILDVNDLRDTLQTKYFSKWKMPWPAIKNSSVPVGNRVEMIKPKLSIV